MGRPCKCRYCQTSIREKEPYLVMIGKIKAYFCDEEHYKLFTYEAEEKKRIKIKEVEEEKQRKLEEAKIVEAEKIKKQEDKNKVYYLICEIVGRKEIINTVLWKEWKEWNKAAPNATIGKYLEENKISLCNLISKIEDNEFLRIRYLSAILKNKLGDYRPDIVQSRMTIKTVTPIIQDEHYETKFKLKKRVALDDLEDDDDE